MYVYIVYLKYKTPSRFSMCSETDSTEENTLNKFATLRRSRRYSSREGGYLKF